MADEESDKVRRTARDALHTMTGSGKVRIYTVYVQCAVYYIQNSCKYVS